jgi:hypothetical protein
MCCLGKLIRILAHGYWARAKAAHTRELISRKLHGCWVSSEKDGLHLSLVKSTMAYGLPAWNPSNKESKTKLEHRAKRRHSVSAAATTKHIMPVHQLGFLKKFSPLKTLTPLRVSLSVEGRVLQGENPRHHRRNTPMDGSPSLPTPLKDCLTDKFSPPCGRATSAKGVNSIILVFTLWQLNIINHIPFLGDLSFSIHMNILIFNY